jgi:hypothetical protein
MQFPGLHVFIGEIHDLPENDRIEQGETDIEAGQEKGQYSQPFIGFEILKQYFHEPV